MFNCYIIGNPLNKPRSVPLWKKYFKKKKIPSSMEPLEIKSTNLVNFIKQVKKNKKFLATAVTSPLKIKAFKFVEPGDTISRFAKSINLIIKKNNKLYGYNTDILSLLKIIKKIKKKNILIIGLGGVGYPLAKVLSQEKKFKISAITRKNIKNFNNVNLYTNFEKIINFKFYLIINCTPLGSNLKKEFKNKTPIPEKFIQYYSNNKFKVLDIIYKPKKNKLYKICKKNKISYSNGVFMNSLQADLALRLISSYLKSKSK